MKLADAFGAQGYHTQTPEQFRVALQKALEHKGPSVIECLIDKDERVLPMIPPGGTVDDIMVD